MGIVFYINHNMGRDGVIDGAPNEYKIGWRGPIFFNNSFFYFTPFRVMSLYRRFITMPFFSRTIHVIFLFKIQPLKLGMRGVHI